MAPMLPNPFLRFHRAAEAAAFPALLIVSLTALLVVRSGLLLLATAPVVIGWLRRRSRPGTPSSD